MQNVTLAGIQWTERYGCYSTVVAGWFHMGFSYEDGSYKITVAGTKQHLTRRGASPTETAELAVSYAKMLLDKARTVLA